MASPTFTQKFAITSAALANCHNLSAVLTVQGLSSCFFDMPLTITHPRDSVVQSDWSCLNSATGSQQFQPLSVTRLFPPVRLQQEMSLHMRLTKKGVVGTIGYFSIQLVP